MAEARALARVEAVGSVALAEARVEAGPVEVEMEVEALVEVVRVGMVATDSLAGGVDKGVEMAVVATAVVVEEMVAARASSMVAIGLAAHPPMCVLTGR